MTVEAVLTVALVLVVGVGGSLLRTRVNRVSNDRRQRRQERAAARPGAETTARHAPTRTRLVVLVLIAAGLFLALVLRLNDLATAPRVLVSLGAAVGVVTALHVGARRQARKGARDRRG